MESATLYVRGKALCCQTWGMSPGEFERAVEADEVAIEDVIEVFFLRASEPFIGGHIRPWLFRESEKSKEETLAALSFLVIKKKAAKTPEEKARIDEEIRKIQGGR